MPAEITKPMRKRDLSTEGNMSPAVILSKDRFEREPLAPGELAALLELVEQMTEQSAQAPGMLEQRKFLFAIGEELKIQRLNSEQARETLDRMRGFSLELGGRKIVVDGFLNRGSYGAVFEVHEEGSKPQNKMVLKVSLPFDRTEMFVGSGATSREVIKAEQYRNFIMEVAALDQLTKETVLDPETGEEITRRMTRNGGVPPVPILIGAQFIPNPENKNQRIAAILMEEIEGPALDTLNQRWDVGRDPKRLLQLATQLATGLKFIHERGVTHGDIKLADIKINSNQDPIFMDLGSASVAKISKRHADSKSGRVNYGRVDSIFAAKDYVTSLEEPLVERDIYALGIVLSKLIFGKQFRRAADREKLTPTLPKTSQQVSALVSQMTMIDSKKRPTIDQIIETLGQIKAV